IVGNAALILVSSVITPSFIGTLKSTRQNTRLPFTFISCNARLFIYLVPAFQLKKNILTRFHYTTFLIFYIVLFSISNKNWLISCLDESQFLFLPPRSPKRPS